MTDDVLAVAIRAEEQAKFAHKRLDAMNGSINRLGDQIVLARREASEQTAQILARLAKDDGYEEGAQRASKGFLDSKWRIIGLCVTALTSGVGTFLFTYLERSHG